MRDGCDGSAANSRRHTRAAAREGNQGAISQLFRQEAIDARRRDWLGATHPATRLLRWCVAAPIIVIYMIVGRYNQRQRVSGQLVPSAGLLNVTATMPGFITRVDVEQGQTVHRRNALLEISVETESASTGDTAAQKSRKILSVLVARLMPRRPKHDVRWQRGPLGEGSRCFLI